MVEVKLNDIGEGMTEAEVLQFFVTPGEQVKADQPLLEVQTDKMAAEIPAPATGIVKEILVNPETTITVGTTIMVIETEMDIAVSTSGERQHELETPPEVFTAWMTKKGRVLAAPYTRKMARENGIDIEMVQGTGPGGRILEADVYRYLETPSQSEKEQEASSDTSFIPEKQSSRVAAFQSAPPGQKGTSPASPAITDEGKAVKEDIIPFRGRRKQIAEKMVKSLYTIPHVTHFEEVDVTELLELKQEFKANGYHVSIAAFFIKALVIALKEYPVFNAKLDEEKQEVKLERQYHIGIATDTDEGLIVPVIRDVDKKTLRMIHDEMKELTRKAKENKLTVKEITGSTFTISNVGPLGSIGATPIINYPETGLVAFHKTKKMPVVRNDEIVIRSIMNLSMSFDHRVADGATAVAFTNRFASLIENPKMLMLEMM